MTGTAVLNVSITFESDWIIGAGYSRSKHLDQSVLVDDLGLPYVPAKTLVGLLRHRAAQVADALDEGTAGVWHRWHTFVFGSKIPDNETAASHSRNRPIPAALFSQPLTMTAAFHKEFEAGSFGELTAKELAQYSTVIRASSAMDRESGTVKADMLRFEERARGGLTVSAMWELQDSTVDGNWPALLLLGSAAKLVFAVGGNRRRGAGQATVDVGVTDDDLKKYFTKVDNVPRPERRPIAAGTASGAAQGRKFDIRITLLQPAIIDASATANSITSKAVLPGSVLLPIVLPLLTDGDDVVRDSLLSVSDATIEVDRYRSVPWPASLAIDKTADDPKAENIARLHVSNPKNKPEQDHYVAADGASISAEKVELRQRLHAVVGDETQGPENLFSTNALQTGTVLRAELDLSEGVSLRDDVLSADRPVRLGRSSKDDYGSATLTVTPAERPDEHRTAVDAGESFPVYLESDAILTRDGAYAPTAGQLIAELNTRLTGTTLAIAEPEHEAGQGEASFPNCVSVIRIDGWQARWGVPKPSVLGLAAGSVISVKADRALTVADLATLDAAPVGVRTVEGKGRIRVAPQWLRAAAVDVPLRTNRPTPAEPWGDAAGTVNIGPMVSSWLRAKIDDAALRAALDDGISNTYIPNTVTNTQLGALRALVANLHTREGRTAYERWLDDDKRTKDWPGIPARLRALESAADDSIWRVLSESSNPGATDTATAPGTAPALPVPHDSPLLTDDLKVTAIQEFLIYAIRKQAQLNQAPEEVL